VVRSWATGRLFYEIDLQAKVGRLGSRQFQDCTDRGPSFSGIGDCSALATA
jgi:hypothetical protein